MCPDASTRRLGVGSAIVGGELVVGDVAIAGGLIAGVGLSPRGRGIAAPGLIDLQVNGFGGVDLLAADDDGWERLGRALLRAGVTAYQPTLISSPPERLVAGLRRATRLRATRGARILGVHLEGPFISPKRLGAHPAPHRRDPDPQLLARLLAAGPVTMVTLAPELDRAARLIRSAVAAGAVVSLGHSDADARTAAAAARVGARSVTHVFNAMAPIAAREPGLAGAALTTAALTPMCIVDGAHLAAETVRLLIAAVGDRLVLTSDAIAAAGTDRRRATLGELSITIDRGRTRGPDGQLAGSAGTLPEAVARLVGAGADPVTAINAATRNPARLLGRPELGTLRSGARADLVVFDDQLRITRVLRGGEPV